MKIDPNLAGIDLKPHHTNVTWRQTTNFAAAVLDNHPGYFDDTKNKELLSHPLFPVAITWPILSRLDQFIHDQTFPTEVLLTQVHYSEHLILRRLVRPGESLTITGHLAALLPHRAGTHAVICLNAVDEQNQLVFTEYVGAMLRGVDCGEGGTFGTIPAVDKNTDDTRNVMWASDIPIDPLQPYIYDGCTNIEFPIHTSPHFAKAVGLPGIILQGTATLAMAVREIVNREGRRNPESVCQVACCFTDMILPGTTIQIVCSKKINHKNHTDLFFEVLNHENKKAIRDGVVKLKRGNHD